MNSNPIVRRIDDMGRVVLPAELRHTLDIEVGERVEFSLEGDSIVLKKHLPACIFCASLRDISTFRGRNICSRCLQELKKQ